MRDRHWVLLGLPLVPDLLRHVEESRAVGRPRVVAVAAAASATALGLGFGVAAVVVFGLAWVGASARPAVVAACVLAVLACVAAAVHEWVDPRARQQRLADRREAARGACEHVDDDVAGAW